MYIHIVYYVHRINACHGTSGPFQRMECYGMFCDDWKQFKLDSKMIRKQFFFFVFFFFCILWWWWLRTDKHTHTQQHSTQSLARESCKYFPLIAAIVAIHFIVHKTIGVEKTATVGGWHFYNNNNFRCKLRYERINQLINIVRVSS